MIDFKLRDGWGEVTRARVSKNGALHVINHPHPPNGEQRINYQIPISRFLVDDNGSNAMNVNASLTSPVEFFITAGDKDLFITSIDVEITDRSMALDLFGGVPELANGLQIIYRSNVSGNEVINEGITTNREFFREATGGKNFGNGNDSWKATVSGAGDETYFPDINFNQRYGLHDGVRLIANTFDRISFIIRDDLTGLTSLSAKAHGFRVFDING